MAMLDGKLGELAQRIADMRRFHKELSAYRRRCAEALEDGAACPLILAVSRPEKKKGPGA